VSVTTAWLPVVAPAPSPPASAVGFAADVLLVDLVVLPPALTLARPALNTGRTPFGIALRTGQRELLIGRQLAHDLQPALELLGLQLA
jgi:hypothetical protein